MSQTPFHYASKPLDDNVSQKQTTSIVREAVKKINQMEESKVLSVLPPPLPPPPHRPFLQIKKNNTYTNQFNHSNSPSISSSSEPIVNEATINPTQSEQQRTQSNEIMITKKTLILGKPQVLPARTNNRPKTQRKPSIHRQNSPPPVPPKTRIYSTTPNDAQTSVHVNSESESKEDSESFKVHAKPVLVHKNPQIRVQNHNGENIRLKLTTNGHRYRDDKSPRIKRNECTNADAESIGLEIAEPVVTVRRLIATDSGLSSDHRDNAELRSSINDHYEQNEIPGHYGDLSSTACRPPPPPPPLPPPPPPAFAIPYLQKPQQNGIQDSRSYTGKRTLSTSNFIMELGALLVIFMVCMVLVLAIQEEEIQLRTTMHLVYSYVYAVSIIWMIWCTYDILKFRREWMALTSPAQDQEQYMAIAERHPNKMSYFPDSQDTGGLFMRIGAGVLCMGSLTLTVIELAKTIASIGDRSTTHHSSAEHYPPIVTATKSMEYILRFLLHCVQFTFLFRYGNLVIDRRHLSARIGLSHLVIANLCTWFDAIVFETLEQMDQHHGTRATNTNNTTSSLYFIKAVSETSAISTGTNASTLEILEKIEKTVGIYLYPCLIEYSLISVTVFFIMWKNVGKHQKRSYLRFGDRHVFVINCSRVSRGLLVGGIIFLLTILTLIPTYLLDDKDAILVTHITELVLLSVSLFTVCIAFIHTTKLFCDSEAHVNSFDQVLILITTVGDFAYSFFGLFASVFANTESTRVFPMGVDISIGFLAIFQTFLQTGFILDTLKRRTATKQQAREKPGREAITALLLINLAIWLHDSLSAKKVKLNPLQIDYYDVGTWAIIQAFTSPLSIFYRFHSSVCLADIWQEVYQHTGNDDGTTRQGGKHGMNRLPITNSGHDNQ